MEFSMSNISVIEFQGMEIEAACSEGVAFANLRRMCESLGISHQRQLEKLKSAHWACVTMMVTHDTSGRTQEMAFLSADSIPMWLATINESKVAEHVRPILRVLQQDIKEVLNNHFFPKPEPSSQLVTINSREFVQSMGEIFGRQLTISMREATLEAVQPVKDQLTKLEANCDERFNRIESRLIEPRRNLTDKTQRIHRGTIHAKYSRKCPCCAVTPIVDENRQKLDTIEFEHWFSRSRCEVNETWAVCVDCNRLLKNPDYRKSVEPLFEAYQIHRAKFEDEDKGRRLPFSGDAP